MPDDRDWPACALCKAEFGSERDCSESFCHGCNNHVCEGCEVNHSLIGSHNLEDHTREPEDGDW